jgi:uncharacterized Zn finger protein (UPF0148 family)
LLVTTCPTCNLTYKFRDGLTGTAPCYVCGREIDLTVGEVAPDVLINPRKKSKASDSQPAVGESCNKAPESEPRHEGAGSQEGLAAGE